ncbi:transglutaminase family protein [Halomonas sp. LS-001]
MTRVALFHRTTYRFDRPVRLSPHVIRLRPAPQCRTPINAYALEVSGDDHTLHWQQDPFGNFNARVVFPEPRNTLSISVTLEADMVPINPFDFFLDDGADTFPFRYSDVLQKELGPYLEITDQGPQLVKWLDSIARTPTPSVDFLVALNQRVQRDIQYEMRMAPGVQSAEDTLLRGIGSCRDSAWLLVQVLRHLGLAARFVSGYLIQLAPTEMTEQSSESPASDDIKEDFCDLHAWAEVFLPGAGWVGLDATSGFLAGEGHIPLAATPSIGSAAAITGTTSPCDSDFDVVMQVKRL